ncbi:MAG: hypothetical protein ORN85_03660 [Sediminibacterium sp.]|nr:hypothetical protein [Sediminibacterium sp.]
MKNIHLKQCGLVQMNQNKMVVIDRGFLPLLVLAASVLLSSCVQINVNSPGRKNGIIAGTAAS